MNDVQPGFSSAPAITIAKNNIPPQQSSTDRQLTGFGGPQVAGAASKVNAKQDRAENTDFFAFLNRPYSPWRLIIVAGVIWFLFSKN